MGTSVVTDAAAAADVFHVLECFVDRSSRNTPQDKDSEFQFCFHVTELLGNFNIHPKAKFSQIDVWLIRACSPSHFMHAFYFCFCCVVFVDIVSVLKYFNKDSCYNEMCGLYLN